MQQRTPLQDRYERRFGFRLMLGQSQKSDRPTGGLLKTKLSVGALASLMLATGCAMPHSHGTTPVYKPDNIFAAGSTLPSQTKRVVLLPMTCDQETTDMVEGRDTLEPVLQVELAKLKRFEIIALNPEMLKFRTGQSAWRCEDALPRDLFSWLQESQGCDAVLFCRLTVFRGYAPLAVGWRMRLVDINTHSTLWACDEVFDASEPGVQAGAEQYHAPGGISSWFKPPDWVIKNSPCQFGQYAAAQILATIPSR
jgi:hypothetical protein